MAASSLVTVRPSLLLGAGRGLFTVRAVRQGELLVSEDALAVECAAPLSPVPACTHCFAALGPASEWVAAVCSALACPSPPEAVIAVWARILALADGSATCARCGARYCGVACREADELHVYLCPESTLTNAVARTSFGECKALTVGKVKLRMVAELLAHLCASVRTGRQDCIAAAATALLDNFTAIPWTCYELADADHFVPAPFASLLGELSPERQSIFDRELADSHAALQELLGVAIPVAVLDAVLGVLVLNSRRIRLYSPLHALLDALPPALAFDVLPLRLALESRPSALTAELSALCPLYAMLNHSCIHTVASALSKEDELRQAVTTGSGRRSRLFAACDLDADTEVFADYMSRSLSDEERRRWLWRQYRIACACAACRGAN